MSAMATAVQNSVVVDEGHDNRPAPVTLGAGAAALFGGGVVLAMLVLPPLHLALLCANALMAFWLSRRSWTWVRKYTSFYLAQTVYFCALFHFPRPGYERHALFRHVLPQGPYFYFLWSAVEVVAVLKLLDFVLCRTERRDPAEFSLPRLGFFLLFPFAFFAGPVIGFEEFYNGYRRVRPGLPDVVYAARKSVWGTLQLFVLAPWLQAFVLAQRESVRAGTGLAAAGDPRLVMWLWIAGMSVLLYIIYKGYTDLMLGASRLAGFRFPEQFWFTLFAKDPAEYWQNGNRGVYRITSQYIFNRMFDRKRLAPKAVWTTGSSGVAHSLMCPGITLGGTILLGVLFGMTGLVVALIQRLRSTRVATWSGWPREGTAHNALVIAGVVLTFALMSFPRSGFLLIVEGVSPPQWLQLVRLLFVRT